MLKHLNGWKATAGLVLVNAIIGGYMMSQPSRAEATIAVYARTCRCNIVDNRCEYEDIGCQVAEYSTCSTTGCPQ